jgi:diguanylate cyclase (GGDEF)-like protein
MQRINTFNRVFAILILVIVASVTVYGYYSFSTTAALGKTAKGTYLWYGHYRVLESLVSRELQSSGSAAAQSDIERTLIALQHAASSPVDQHAVRAMLHLQQSGSYDALRTLVIETLQRRLVDVEKLRVQLENVQRQLEWTMVGVGLFGLAIAELATQLELRRLKKAVKTDSLTALGNHRAFREDLEREISRSRRYGHPLSLALIDIDDFKSLNDTNGHWRGDEVLVETARALESGRQEDRVYRTGGDEFAVLLNETRAAQAHVALARLHDNVKRRPGTASISIGFCELEKDFNGNDLYERADAALYAAKKHGRDAIVGFGEIRDNITIFSAEKASSLETLLQSRALAIAFQPIWHMNGKRVLGFEALARPNPSLGFSGPEEAFDVAEHQRRVADLDRLCFGTILSAAAGLPRDQLVFINVTPETLGRLDFQPKQLVASVRAAGFVPGQIVIEVTERRITDSSELVEHVRELRKLGVLVALDDTGAGHAGLEILSKVTFDFVKIDRSVVLEAMSHKRARGVLAGIVAIARAGESFVIVEGVENLEQFKFVRALQSGPVHDGDIAGMQGYLLGRPRCGPPAATGLEEGGQLVQSDANGNGTGSEIERLIATSA